MVTVAVTKPVKLKFTVSGRINDEPLAGHISGSYDYLTNTGYGKMVFTEMPSGYEALLQSCTSHVSWNVSIFSLAREGAVNLNSLFGDSWEVEIDYLITDETRKKVIGLIEQSGVSERINNTDEIFVKAHVKNRGWYDGPTNITTSPGYAIYLRQLRPGAIEGIYGQVILCEDGKPIYELCRRLYKYDTKKTLPFDEVWHYKLLWVKKYREDGREIREFKSISYYSPAKVT